MAQWSELMRMPLREMRIGGSIVLGSGKTCNLDGDKLFSLEIDEGAGGVLLPGCVLSANCRVDLVNDAGQWNPGGSLRGQDELIGATLLPRLGVMDGQDVLWQDLGVFVVESALNLEGENVMRLQAQDSIADELSAAFEDKLSYPQTLNGLWNYALSQTRYTWQGRILNGSAVIGCKPDWKGASIREALGHIAAAAGCFVHVNRQGSLALKPVWNADNGETAIDGDSYLKLESDERHYGPVDALKLKYAGSDTEKTYLAGSGLHVLQADENPLFMQGDAYADDLASAMLLQVAGFETDRLRFTWRGDPALNIGDRIALTDLDGGIHHGVLSRQSLRYDGAFSAVCACDVPDDGNYGVRRAITPEGGLNASALVGAVNGALITAGSITAEKIAAGSITTEKLAAGAIETGALEAVTAKIESLTAGDITTDRLAAAMAAFTVLTAGTADFDQATVAHLVTQALNLDFGTAGEVFIRNLRVAYAQMVSAAIGSLVIQASDGKYYQIDVDASGKVTAENVTVTDQELAAGLTAGGRVILATDITADSLNASSLLATYALVNKIDAARIDVDTLCARQAFIAHLNTADISSNSSIQIAVGKAEDALEKAESGVAKVDVQYYLSDSTTELSGGKWQTAAPEWVNGKYMWSRTVTTLHNGTVRISTAACIAGAKGDRGEPGMPGADGSDGASGSDGVGVDAIEEQFYLSSGKDAPVGGSWVNEMPQWQPGLYVWTRSAITYSDGSTDYTQPYCDTGWEAANGAQETADAARAEASSAAQDAANAQDIAGAALPRADFKRVVRIDSEGLHVGDNQASGEVLIDSASVNVRLGGQTFSSFGANYVEFGSYQLRRTADGGLAFKMR